MPAMPTARAWPDRLLAALDQGLRAIAAPPAATHPSPAAAVAEPALTADERRKSAALMRVNHAGEIAAQALYNGQALLARSASTYSVLEQAAREERDHLAWCAERIEQLGGRTSVLTPLWYLGSFGIGVLAGLRPDADSLGFVHETEMHHGRAAVLAGGAELPNAIRAGMRAGGEFLRRIALIL